MARILLFGTVPLPHEPGESSFGPGLRTYQFLKPLREAGYEIGLVGLRAAGTFSNITQDRVDGPLPGGGMRYNLSYEAFHRTDVVRRIAEDFKPDAVFGVGSVLPCYMATRVGDRWPVWVDLFGDPITELQAKAALIRSDQDNTELFHVWKMLKTTLRDADKYSSLSRAQGHAVVGQLGLEGRLSGTTGNYRFVHVIPCGIEKNAGLRSSDRGAGEKLRGKDIPDDAFVLCWSGSYNTWTDIPTLLAGLRAAMEKLPNLYYFSTGGETKGYNEKVYGEFLRGLEQFPAEFRKRIVLKGWLPYEPNARLTSQADLGLNVDRWTYEGMLGSRNRIVQFLALEVAVLTTPLSEVSLDLETAGAVATFEIGNAQEFASRVAELESDRERLKGIARKGRLFVETNYDFSATMVSALRWAASPSFAPDREEPNSRVLDSPAPQNEVQRWSDFRSYVRLIERRAGPQRGVVSQIARSAKEALSRLCRRSQD
ncbi:MAG: hypothetical protein V2A74_05180 [bacterium]